MVNDAAESLFYRAAYIFVNFSRKHAVEKTIHFRVRSPIGNDGLQQRLN